MKGKGNIKFYMHSPLSDAWNPDDGQASLRSRSKQITRLRFNRLFGSAKSQSKSACLRRFCSRFTNCFKVAGRKLKRSFSGLKLKRKRILLNRRRTRRKKIGMNDVSMFAHYISALTLICFHLLSYDSVTEDFRVYFFGLNILYGIVVMILLLFFRRIKDTFKRRVRWGLLFVLNLLCLAIVWTQMALMRSITLYCFESVVVVCLLHFEFISKHLEDHLCVKVSLLVSWSLVASSTMVFYMLHLSYFSPGVIENDFQSKPSMVYDWDPDSSPEDLYKNILTYLVLKLVIFNFGVIGQCVQVVHTSRDLRVCGSLKKTETTVSENILQEMIPRHISFDMLKYGMHQTEEIKNVTLLFADIAGFTAFSAKNQPRAIIDMLQRLFTNFDRKCKGLNLYKVCTIGDCYVTMSCTDSRARNKIYEEVIRTIELGFDMIEVIRKVQNEIDYKGLNMRIGVHTGDVFGRVMGSDIVRYDLFGNHVTMANEIESLGKNNMIHVSDITMNIIKNSKYADDYIFEKHNNLSIGDIVDVDTYLIHKK